jgi:CheY-like chemotaxis protein
MRILIAEDEDEMRTLYRQVFEAAHFEVDTAENGEKALFLLRKGGYDVGLIDIRMPIMDGFTVVETLAKTPPLTPNGPLLFLTNNEGEEAIARGISLNVRGYLLKVNYTPDQLVAEVQKILAQRKQ